MSVVDLVLEAHAHLTDAGMSHAFGGALALAYVAEPRHTVDVDVNVFSPIAVIDDVLAVFAGFGMMPEQGRATWLPAAGIRLRRADDPWPIDLFPSLDEQRYANVERRRVRKPFGPAQLVLPFLSAEDLTVFKLSFGREKDWVDLRAIASARPDLDVDYIEEQLLALRGPQMHPRLARLRRLLRAGAG